MAERRPQLADGLDRLRGERRTLLAELEADAAADRKRVARHAINAVDFSPRALADAGRRGPDALAANFGIRGAQAESLAAAGESLFLRLEELTVATAAEASLNVASTGGTDFRRLQDLSLP
jgi:hypothetical protein